MTTACAEPSSPPAAPHAALPAAAPERDLRPWRIPRSAVFGSGTLGAPTPEGWPRVDSQGKVQLTSNGRAAILLALEAMGVGPGDRVLLPTYHCPTMVEPAVRLGAAPLFYPVGADGAADLAALQQLDTERVKALLAAHFFGLPQDMRPLRRFCDERGIALIEDCAHAFFGRSAQGPLGSVGDVAIASLPKFFASVEGGCLVQGRADLPIPELAAPGAAHELRVAWDAIELAGAAGRLRRGAGLVHALVALKNRLRGRAAQPMAAPPPAGLEPSPFDTIDERRAHTRAAAFARWVVRRSDAQRIVRTRRANYRHFVERLTGVPGMRPLFPQLAEGAAPYVFPLLVDNPERLYRALRESGVPLYRWDILWPGTPLAAGDAATTWSTRVFQLCCHQDMTDADVELVVTTVRQLAGTGAA